jgi:hypothetical protein
MLLSRACQSEIAGDIFSIITGCGSGAIQSRDQEIPYLTSRPLDFSGSDSNAITEPIP